MTNRRAKLTASQVEALHRRFIEVEDALDDIRSNFDGVDGPRSAELTELEIEKERIREDIEAAGREELED